MSKVSKWLNINVTLVSLFNKYKNGKVKWKRSLRKSGNQSRLNINMTLIYKKSWKVRWKWSLLKKE